MKLILMLIAATVALFSLFMLIASLTAKTVTVIEIPKQFSSESYGL